MKVTIQNWSTIEKTIRDVGIRQVERDSMDVLQAVITNDGQRFEFSQQVFEEFKKAGLLRLGVRINKQK